MMAINGRIQREEEAVHLVGQQLFDLSEDLSGLADHDTDRGDEFARGGGRPDSRDRPKLVVLRDMFTPDDSEGFMPERLLREPCRSAARRAIISRYRKRMAFMSISPPIHSSSKTRKAGSVSIGVPRAFARSMARFAIALRVSGSVLMLFRPAFLMSREI